MSVRVKGLDQAIREIQKKGKDAEKVVVEVLQDTATDIELDAKIDAPYSVAGVILGIKQRIDKIPKNKGLIWQIGIQGTQDFDAYVEFGTGLSAREILFSSGYTPEMRAIAKQFYKNGKGTLVGQPFLFPAWIRHTANLVEEIKKEIAERIK